MVFNVIVRLDDDRDFSDVLNARKQQLERSLSTVSVISWAASPKSESEHLGARRIEGFVHDGTEPNSTGMLETCNAGETEVWHRRNYTSCL